jgi:charged multivesicular body protein 3
MGLFGKTKDPKDHVREMTRKMRSEITKLERQVNQITRKEEQIKREIKAEAKKGNKDACLVLAKGLVHSRRAVSKMYMAKTQINSAIMGMQHQLATMRMAGSIQSSNEVMQAMQKLVKVPEIMATMRELSKEMTKAGIITEMIEETMESIEPEELEEQAAKEVDKVLWEVTEGQLGEAPEAITDNFTNAEEERFRQQADALVAQLEGAHQS